jgi:hypothetical protein
MYKKITHTITEEHFDHPEALRMKSRLECYPVTTGTTPAPTPSVFFMMPDRAKQLTTAAHKLLSNYAQRIRSHIVSILDSAADKSALDEQLTKDIKAIGAVVSAYYGETAGNEVDMYLTKIAAGVADIARAVKSGKSIDDLKTNLLRDVDFFATLLESANPKHWPAAAVRDIFTMAVNTWISQIQARDNKKWSEDIALADRIIDIFTGNGMDDAGLDFAKTFAEGIIKQFPEKFSPIFPIPA